MRYQELVRSKMRYTLVCLLCMCIGTNADGFSVDYLEVAIVYKTMVSHAV